MSATLRIKVDECRGATRRPRLAELARQIERLRVRYAVPHGHCPCGLPTLDDALGGGFARGAVHELVGTSDATPVRSIALRTAARAAGRQRWVMYLDNADDCYPPGLAQLGIPLGRLLVIHTRNATDTFWVCEQALRCSAIAAVVASPRHMDTYVSRRLQLAAEAGGGLGLLLRPDAEQSKTFAASRVRFEPLAHDTEVRQVLATVLKLREGSPSGPFVVELCDASGVVSVSAVSVDRSSAARRPSRAG